MTIPLLRSSATVFQKLLFNSVITTILILVDGNSYLVIANSETWGKSCFCKSLLGKQPSHLSLEGNCSLQLFLPRVWQLTMLRCSQRIFRNNNTFDNAFWIIFCLCAEDLHCNISDVRSCFLELSLGSY